MNKKLYKPLVKFLGALTIVCTITSCECARDKKEELEKQQAEKEKLEKEQSVEVDKIGTVIQGTLDPATGNFIYETGDIFTIKLPNGEEIFEVGNNSTEAKLFNFLKDSTLNVSEDKTKGWITLDRVYFDTGKTTLTTESGKQIKNLSQILKAFPKAKVKIGGYTDTTGSEETNKKVSEDRAKIVQEELIKSGVQTERISSEGYGSQHPVCEANDTPECKAQNRRVDIRVLEK
ncbi:OmpA family protein [Apibacter sp. B3889]|uniref:OmpA family protein n=1 Tax=unclassified Apibacter TaxID=2630820 RepID=UPI0013225C65|nr:MULTISPECIES: OmpA family protein [unclassified Apibacter]MXO34997.1 OmpA family protein [Apibacter sp. B3883]MXO42355.1 OmpA family protein [Apibacter sp. B3889]MXP04372.1 OmpA family protein [Apibacter sp. B3887]MXP08447.1 OmpA family protein [Apibacter sp. B3935]